jgi:hypothetical protein
MLAPFALLVAAVSALLAVLRRRRRRLPARAMIISPRRSTVLAKDGTVTSVQSAELSMSRERLDRLWIRANMENLARTYWRFLTRVTLGLIRVDYGTDERSVVLLGKPLTLLRFEAPEYVLESDHGSVRWRIRDGLLVAKAGRGCGFLSLDVRRLDTGDTDQCRLLIEVEVANFYPAIAAGFSMPAYMATQAFVHVLVTHAFLRSLATLDLAESKVKALADGDADGEPAPDAPRAAAQP